MTRHKAALVGVVTVVAATAYVISKAVFAPGRNAAPPPSHASAAGARSRVARGTITDELFVRTSVRSLTGAVDAAVTYLNAFDDPVDYGDALALFREITLSPLTAQADRGLHALTTMDERLAHGGAGFVRGWALGWRVVFFSPDVARVQIWTMGTVASPAEVLAPYWSTTTCVLRWSDDRWKVASAQSAQGPVPPGRNAARGAIESFVRSASRFHAFADQA